MNALAELEGGLAPGASGAPDLSGEPVRTHLVARQERRGMPRDPCHERMPYMKTPPELCLQREVDHAELALELLHRKLSDSVRPRVMRRRLSHDHLAVHRLDDLLLQAQQGRLAVRLEDRPPMSCRSQEPSAVGDSSQVCPLALDSSCSIGAELHVLDRQARHLVRAVLVLIVLLLVQAQVAVIRSDERVWIFNIMFSASSMLSADAPAHTAEAAPITVLHMAQLLVLLHLGPRRCPRRLEQHRQLDLLVLLRTPYGSSSSGRPSVGTGRRAPFRSYG